MIKNIIAFLLASIILSLSFSRIQAEDTSATDIIMKAKNLLEISETNYIKDSIVLPNAIDINGTLVFITWHSSNSDVISPKNGYVNKKNNKVNVNLTAIFSFSSITDKKVFHLTVAPANKPNVTDIFVLDHNTIKVTFDKVPSTDLSDYELLVYGNSEDYKLYPDSISVNGNIATITTDMSGIAGELIVNDVPSIEYISFDK